MLFFGVFFLVFYVFPIQFTVLDKSHTTILDTKGQKLMRIDERFTKITEIVESVSD